jgi:hypothetical protein
MDPRLRFVRRRPHISNERLFFCGETFGDRAVETRPDTGVVIQKAVRKSGGHQTDLVRQILADVSRY